VPCSATWPGLSVPPTSPATSDPGRAVPRVRVVTYNVHGLRDDLDALTGVVRELDPDVLVVQEAPRRLRWRYRCAELARRFRLVYAAGGGPGLGNLILVGLRVAVPEAWALRYPLTPGRHMRGAAFARCVVDRATFVVAGTHLSLDGAERLAQARLLDAALTGLPGAPPVVLAGDLNEPPDAPAWRLLAAPRVDAAGADATPTFPAAAAGVRIDALLVDRRIAIAGYRVVSSAGTARASDHLPVLAELDLPR
jgi:endonuclease/exonuclease/phosphatase family metal-dependent hydrolase